MSSSGSEISTSLPISEMIKHIKHSFRERDFPKVQSMLMDREKEMKMEIEILIKDRDSAKEEVRLLERNGDLAELERLKLEEKLQKNRRKCEELEETVTRLLEEKRVSNGREKRAEERCDKIAAENSKMANEKNKAIFELNEKINELKSKNLENERLVVVYQEKCKCLDIEIAKMGREMEELRVKQLEANKTIDGLRLKKSESDKAAELYKSRLQNLSPRIRKIEEELAGMLTVKVGDLADLVNDVRKLASSEEGRILNFRHSRGKDESSGNGSTADDAEDILVVLSPGMRSQSLSRKGDRTLVQDHDTHTIKPSPGSQSVRYPPQPESNELEEPLGSVAHGSGTRLNSGAGHFSKVTRSSSAGGDIIQIVDSDDEAKPDGADYISNRGVVGSNVGEDEINFVWSPSSTERSKKKRTDCMGDLFASSTTKRKTNTCTSDKGVVLIHEKENEVVKSSHDRIASGEGSGPPCDTQTPIDGFNGLHAAEVSSDSDESSYTDSRMDDLIASLGSKKLGRKFIYEADMLRAFQQDEQLCMSAVCALYRQQVKSKGRSDLTKIGGVDSVSGCTLAEYLIDGDKELRLRKSVSQVKKQHPDVIGQCRKLANIYIEKLFAIYCAGEDPLFCQSS